MTLAGRAMGAAGDIDRVLIVEDEEPVRRMIARMVQSGGQWECETTRLRLLEPLVGGARQALPLGQLLG